MIIQNTIYPEIKDIYDNDGTFLGEINTLGGMFEATHANGLKANFSTMEGALRLFRSLCRPCTPKTNNQTTINF